MSDTFRSLCVDLVDVLKLHCRDCEFSWEVIERAEKLLSQSEPEFTAEEIDMNAAPCSQKTSTPPEPEVLTSEEILDINDQVTKAFPPIHHEAKVLDPLEYSRELEVRKARAFYNLGLQHKITSSQSSGYSETEGLTDEELIELRENFERILCDARSSGGPTVGNIALAGHLLDAVSTRFSRPHAATPAKLEILVDITAELEGNTTTTTQEKS